MFRHPLAREVMLIVAVKTVLVIAAGLLVFGPRQRPAINPGSLEQRLLDAPAQPLPHPRSR